MKGKKLAFYKCLFTVESPSGGDRRVVLHLRPHLLVRLRGQRARHLDRP